MSSLRVREAGVAGHHVQLDTGHGDTLARNVGNFLWEGWKKGEGIFIVATPEHQSSFTSRLRELGVPVEQAIGEGRMVVVDSHSTLARFMKDGQPDASLFDNTVGADVRRFQNQAGQKGFRACGDMVGILWTAGQFSAAIELEQFWNTLLEAHGFQLFCSYPVDVFGDGFDAATMDALLCTHSHVVTAETGGHMTNALNRAMDETLGNDRPALNAVADRSPWAGLPEAESTILWLKDHLPEYAGEIMCQARRYFQESLIGSAAV
jgi:hypothetical protein